VGYYAATGFIGAGIGALVGSAIDHARKTSQVIYVSAQP